jgi:hypothetical protein
MEVKSDIDPIEIEETCMTIQLANKEIIFPIRIVRNVEVLVGKIKYLVDFIVIACPQDSFYCIIFGRPFFHTIGAELIFQKIKLSCFIIVSSSLCSRGLTMT